MPDSGIPLSCADSLGSGRLHHCMITGEGDLSCWGENTLGQIGDNDNEVFSDVPVSAFVCS